MTNEDLIKLIGAEEPALLDKIAAVFKEAEGDEDLLRDLAEGVSLVAQRIDEFEKTSGPVEKATGFFKNPDVQKSMREGAGKAIGGAAVAAAAGLALAGGSDLYNYAKSTATKHRNWKRLMAHNPHWGKGQWDENSEMTEEQRKKLPAAFNTVHRLAPSIASDPIAASSYVRQLTNAPESGEIMKKMVETQKTVNDLRERKRIKT